jgi:hypothetical protein
MRALLAGAFVFTLAAVQPAYALCPYDQDCLNNPNGAASVIVFMRFARWSVRAG